MMDLIQPGIMSRIVDEGVLGTTTGGVGNLRLIWQLGLQMMGLVIVGGLSGSLNNVFVHISSQNIGNEMRKDCFRNIMAFSFPQVDGYTTGSLVTRVTNDVTQVQNFIAQFVRGMIRTTLLTVGSIVFMFRLDARFGWVVLCALPFMLGCMTLCLSKANPLFEKLQAQLDRINSIMQEDVSGIRIIKACVREVYEKLRFGKANNELVGTQLSVLIIFAFMNPVMNALMYIVVVIILLMGSYQVTAGATTPGVIMAAITYTTQLLNGILSLVMLFQRISRGVVSWKRVKEVLDSKPQLEDGPCEGPTEARGRIEFKNVSFAYPGSSRKVLRDVSLTIEPGQTVAIMGVTGCGKSTVVNLLMRFYDPDSGRIRINGQSIADVSRASLRHDVAIVLQDTVLFSDTVGNNLTYGNAEASRAQLEEAVRMSRCREIVDRLPEGYDTFLTGAGANLSQGQRQLLAIARAFVADPRILILDEATSNVDTRTEKAIQDAMQQVMRNRTSIVIAHRLSTIRDSDCIVVMDKGRIVESGTHDELLGRKGRYYELYMTQFAGFATRRHPKRESIPPHLPILREDAAGFLYSGCGTVCPDGRGVCALAENAV